MNTAKHPHFKPLFTALFSVAVAALAQPPALPDVPRLRKLVGEGLTQVYGIPNTPFVLKYTKPGDASSGVVVATTNDTLLIDPTPCVTNQKGIITFVKPYKESKISDARCNGKSYPQIQVIQQ
ncbi:MAG: hypothetical protein DME93_06575 [Verrucomicrobia bacterium]|nr:MAG: hypothetical protein DME93_06575 [Verrucomicrobiota bacterium]